MKTQRDLDIQSKEVVSNPSMSSPVENSVKFSRKSYLAEIISDNLNEVIKKDQSRSIPLFLRIKRDFIKNLANKIVQNPAKNISIGVSGESASGKTTLVQNAIKACTGDKSELYTVVCCDDYFHDWSEELKSAGSYENLFKQGYNFDTPDAVNLELMRQHIIELQMGKQIYSPKYDFVTCVSDLKGTLKEPNKVILAEGLFTLNTKLKDVFDICVYVHTPLEIIKKRWYERAESRGKTGKAADLQFNLVSSEAGKHIRPTMMASDIIVNGMTSSEYIEYISDELINAVSDAIG